MSNKVKEHYSFLLKKVGIMRDHVSQEAQLRVQFASRGFVVLPGQFFDAISMLESYTKLKLDEANLQVLQEAIEYELRLKGLENNVLLRDARMAFAIMKTGLMNDLNLELAGLQKQIALEGHAAKLLAVEIAVREVVLLLGEAVLKKSLEQLQQLQLDEEARPLAKEVELAQTKLDLANEKLKIIPFIRTVITEQRKVIDYERDEIAPLMNQKIAKQEDLIDIRRDELLPAMEALSTTIKAWAVARPDVIAAMSAKADALMNLAHSEDGLTAFIISLAQARLGYAESLMELLPYRVEISTAEVNKAQNLLEKANADLLVANAELRLAREQGKRIKPLSEKSDALSQLADKKINEVVPALEKDAKWRLLAAHARAAAATAKELSMTSEIQFLLASATAEEAQLAVELTKASLDIIRRQGALLELQAESSGFSRVNSQRNSSSASYLSTLSALASAKESRINGSILTKTRAEIAATETRTDAESDMLSDIGDASESAQLEVADTNAYAQVSSRLIHNIG